MRSYNYYHSKDGFGVTLTEGPWWSFLPEELSNLVFNLCDKLPKKPFMHEYYSIHDRFHMLVCNKICQWAGKIEDKYQVDYRITLTDDQAKIQCLDFYNSCEQYNDDKD